MYFLARVTVEENPVITVTGPGDQVVYTRKMTLPFDTGAIKLFASVALEIDGWEIIGNRGMFGCGKPGDRAFCAKVFPFADPAATAASKPRPEPTNTSA